MPVTSAATTSTHTTNGITVSVKSAFLAEQSAPQQGRFVFAYTITIANAGTAAAQLQTRHWVITDGRGEIQEVRGPGVVGETPHLEPGQAFRYTSGCILATPVGMMHGSYQMVTDEGRVFDVTIAPFSLLSPWAGHQDELN